MAKLLDGKKIAHDYLELAQKKIAQIKRATNTPLRLATIRVGEPKDVILYSNYLNQLLKKIGIEHLAITFPENQKEELVIAKIRELNRDSSVTGIMVFSPLPKTINPVNIFDNISAKKDAEGRTFLKSHFGVFSPTANAVMTLLESTKIDLSGKEAVVVGHSDLVGKPIAVLLMDKYATVTVCHVKTKDAKKHISKADVVVAAVGKPNIINGSWIKKGAIVIDVGENFVNGKIVGDIEFNKAVKRASFMTPVPGGVGPVTNVMLVKNLIRLYEAKEGFNGNS